MRAVVLVGGEGTRLRPLTYTVPKQMLPIVEQPMIERVIGHLADHGIEEAVLSLGYRPDAFMNAYPDDTIAGVHLAYAVEPEPRDTAGAIRFAARHCSVDETFVVVNGDVLTDSDLSALIDFHRLRGAEATIALTPMEDPSAFGVVPTDAQGRVLAFIEKPPRDEAPTNLINAGTYIFEPSVLDRIPPDVRVSVERETFPAMVEDGTLFAQGSDAYWLDTGTPDAYLRAHRDLILGRRDGPPAPAAELAARDRPRGVADRGGRRGRCIGHPVGPGPWGVGWHRRSGRGVGDRCRRGGRGRGLGGGIGAPARGPGRLDGHGGGIGDRSGCDRGATVRDPRPVGDRCRRHHRVGNRHRRRTDRRGGLRRCARWSPAGQGSSVRRWWTGSWPKGTRWT